MLKPFLLANELCGMAECFPLDGVVETFVACLALWLGMPDCVPLSIVAASWRRPALCTWSSLYVVFGNFIPPDRRRLHFHNTSFGSSLHCHLRFWNGLNAGVRAQIVANVEGLVLNLHCTCDSQANIVPDWRLNNLRSCGKLKTLVLENDMDNTHQADIELDDNWADFFASLPDSLLILHVGIAFSQRALVSLMSRTSSSVTGLTLEAWPRRDDRGIQRHQLASSIPSLRAFAVNMSIDYIDVAVVHAVIRMMPNLERLGIAVCGAGWRELVAECRRHGPLGNAEQLSVMSLGLESSLDSHARDLMGTIGTVIPETTQLLFMTVPRVFKEVCQERTQVGVLPEVLDRLQERLPRVWIFFDFVEFVFDENAIPKRPMYIGDDNELSESVTTHDYGELPCVNIYSDLLNRDRWATPFDVLRAMRLPCHIWSRRIQIPESWSADRSKWCDVRPCTCAIGSGRHLRHLADHGRT